MLLAAPYNLMQGIAIMESDSLLQALQQRNRLRPACLTAELIHMDDKTMQGLDSAEAMQALPVLKVKHALFEVGV